jgi:hypothetical protein
MSSSPTLCNSSCGDFVLRKIKNESFYIIKGKDFYPRYYQGSTWLERRIKPTGGVS